MNKNANPVVNPPRKIPYALKNKVKNELNRLENMRVIEKSHRTYRMGEFFSCCRETEQECKIVLRSKRTKLKHFKRTFSYENSGRSRSQS